MTVKEFCKANGLKYQTVYKKIAHHKNKELAGHVTKFKGESIDLDDYAVDFLTPFNVKVIKAMDECQGIVRENDELKNKLYAAELNLEQAESKLSDITDENERLTVKISELTKQLELQCEKYRQKISELEHKAADYEKNIAELTEENSTLKAQLEAIPKFFRKNQ